MAPQWRYSRSEAFCFIMGGSVGALVRAWMAYTWPRGSDLLKSTVIITIVVFVVAGAMLGRTITGASQYFVVGLCAGAVSVSATSLLAVGAKPVFAAVLVALTAVAALAGLTIGLVLSTARARRHGRLVADP